MMSETMIEFGRRVLASQPFSAFMGVRLETFEPGLAEILLDIREHHCQQHGFVHGGVISYLADSALAFAGGSVLGDSLTLEFKINFLKPAMGLRLAARARVSGNGRSQAVCRCDVFTDDGQAEKLCATAQGTVWKVG
jgi:uncharacterized protein (TIGR00369 family)